MKHKNFLQRHSVWAVAVLCLIFVSTLSYAQTVPTMDAAAPEAIPSELWDKLPAEARNYQPPKASTFSTAEEVLNKAGNFQSQGCTSSTTFFSTFITQATVDPATGTIYFTTANTIGPLYSINPAAGDVTPTVVSPSFAGGFGGHPFISTDIFYYDGYVYSISFSNQIFRVDVSTGMSELVLSVPGIGIENGVVVCEDILYFTDGSSTLNNLYSYDLTSGQLDIVVSQLPSSSYEGLAFGEDGTLYYGAQSHGIYVVDLAGGTITNRSTFSTRYMNLVIDGPFAYLPANNRLLQQVDLSTGTAMTFDNTSLFTGSYDNVLAPSSSGAGLSLYRTNSLSIFTTLVEIDCPFFVNDGSICASGGLLTLTELGCSGDLDSDDDSNTHTLTATNCYYANPFTQDRITFGSTNLCGDGEIVVELSDIEAFGWAGVMMRETLAPGSKKVSLARDNGFYARREARSATNGPAYPQQFPAFGKNWLRLVRQGNVFRGFLSQNGVNWQQVMVSNIQMSECIEVGLFLTNKQFSTQTITADFANLMISEANGALQQLLPTVLADSNPTIGIFPNPTSGPLTIELGDWADKDVQLEVRNTNGQTVQQHDLGIQGDRRVDLQLDALTPGIYWLRIQAAGEAPISRRIAVQR